MLSIVRVFLAFLLVSSQLNLYEFGVLAKSVARRSLPQYMEDDHSNEQPHPEHRSHITKIHPKKSQRSSDDPIMSDVTAFRGMGHDHNAFGGPTYSAQLYPFGDLSTHSNQEQTVQGNFSFLSLLSGLALWNLANEFNMYSSQDRNIYINRDQQKPHELATNRQSRDRNTQQDQQEKRSSDE